MKKANPSPLNALAALFVLVVGSIAGSAITLWFVDTEAELHHFNGESVSFEETWNHSAEAVVSIVALKELQLFYDAFGQINSTKRAATSVFTEVSSGTGFLIAPDGLAVTNRHVVEDEDAEYVAILSDGSELDVEVLARDSSNDIAIIQVKPGAFGILPYLDFGDSDALQVGQPVLAIGNALGEYSHTATSGIVSALNRNILTSSGIGKPDSLIDLIQTDAAINSGNSGGPLLSLEGEVIGMNTAVDTQGDGIGFALPSNAIVQAVESYETHGEIVRPQLGVHYLILDAAVSQRFGMKYDYGALLLGDRRAGILAVSIGSPADLAGLQQGDLILSINNKEITKSFTLENALLPYDLGDVVLIEYVREGGLYEVEVGL